MPWFLKGNSNNKKRKIKNNNNNNNNNEDDEVKDDSEAELNKESLEVDDDVVESNKKVGDDSDAREFDGDEVKMRNRRSSHYYMDPIFGIPLAHPPNERHHYPKRRWRHANRRVDPSVPAQRPSSPLDHMLPAAFFKFGRDPDSYLAARQASILLLLAAAAAAWVWAGMSMGLVVGGGGRRKEERKISMGKEEERVLMMAVREEVDWVPGLTRRLKSRLESLGTTKGAFVCCLSKKDQAAVVECLQDDKEEEEFVEEIEKALSCPSGHKYKFRISTAAAEARGKKGKRRKKH